MTMKIKMGFASLLFVKCPGTKCEYLKKVYSSATVGTSQDFEVNRIIALASTNIGVGHKGLVKFTGTMNMRPPMNGNAYRNIVEAVRKAAQTVFRQSMEASVNDVKSFYEPEKYGVLDIGISSDGTWRRRGHSTLYGIVITISDSTVSGKATNIEIMSKECKECTAWRTNALRNMKIGGTATNIVTWLIILGRPDQWMPLAFLPYFSGQSKNMQSAKQGFWEMGTVKPTCSL